MATPLSKQQLSQALAGLPKWKQAENSIQREFQFRDFRSAMMFVNELAEVAEELGHHPDIDIRYNVVRLSLNSHDAGGVTDRDLKLAERIDKLPEQRAA